MRVTVWGVKNPGFGKNRFVSTSNWLNFNVRPADRIGASIKEVHHRVKRE
jgi:hypothetical protein